MARIPLTVKLIYTAFVAVLVPYYWTQYTPWNFLYFCDVALLMTLAGIWMENRLLISLAAVGILMPQTLWVLDFLLYAAGGIHLTGMTAYMFNPKIPVFVRALSSFHGWLPFVLVWLVWRLGYDRRAVRLQPVIATTLLLFCFFAGPMGPAPAATPNHAVNINYVFGMDDATPQHSVAPGIWLAVLITVNIVLFHLPTHIVLRRVAPARG